MQKTTVYRILSFVAVMLIIAFVLVAYVRMQNVFEHYSVDYSSTSFMVLVWTIILSAFLLFYINWQNILQVESLLARRTKSVDEQVKELESKTEDNDLQVDVVAEAEKILLGYKPAQNLEENIRGLMELLSQHFELVTGLAYQSTDGENYEPLAQLAWAEDHPPAPFRKGEGLAGQVAAGQKMLIINDLPKDYIRVVSATGKSYARCLMIFPLAPQQGPSLVMELAFFNQPAGSDVEIISRIVDGFFTMLNAKSGNDE